MLREQECDKPIFFDMKHSNNAARIRLWLALKDNMAEEVERCVVTYPELKTRDYAAVNPLMKAPAFVRADGSTVFESAVILSYLEDKYASCADGSARGPSFKPPTPEGRQLMEVSRRDPPPLASRVSHPERRLHSGCTAVTR